MERNSTVQPGCTKQRNCQRKGLRERWNATLQERKPSLGRLSISTLQESVTRGREGHRNCCSHARDRQIPRILPGDDLRRFSSRRQPGRDSAITFIYTDFNEFDAFTPEATSTEAGPGRVRNGSKMGAP